ncbi:hypothetical protein BH10ACT2_BH10ACT2_25780 [soil metagenome]
MRRLLVISALAGLVVFQALPVHTALAADGDGDKVADGVDVCPTVADPFQGDVDGNGVGDLCEPDSGGTTSFDGTPANDLVLGTSGADTLHGAGGDDGLYGLEGDDTLDGGDGNDLLVGGPGTDTLTGGGGCDVFAFDPAGDGDVITDYDPSVDRLSFPAQDDNPGNDPVPTPSFGGDDHLVVTFATDGGTSATLDFEGLPAGVQIALSNQPCSSPPIDEVVPPVLVPEQPPVPPTAPPFVCAPLYDFQILPDFFDLVLTADGKTVAGTSGNDALTGTHCGDVIAGDEELVFINSQGPDEFDTTECADNICGDDVINGLAGNDLLIGDKAVLSAGERGGNDTIHGGDGDDVIIGDAGNMDSCTCDGVGGAHSEVAGPIGGNDNLFGDDGNDIIFGDGGGMGLGTTGGNDYIDGGNGDDIIFGDGQYLFDGSLGGNDTLIGGAGDDTIFGDAVVIDGYSEGGDDRLVGGAGDDYLVGDALGIDGYAGHDTFVYDTAANFGDDIIADLGVGETRDVVEFTGSGLTDIVSLDARSTVSEVGTDVVAIVFTNVAKTTQIGSITFLNIATGGIGSWADLVDTGLADVVVVP